MLLKSQKNATETLAMIRKVFGEESMNCTRKVQPHQDRKKAREEKSKVKSMLIILTQRGLFAKNSFWQAKQSIPHTTMMFCGNCVKLCEDFALNFSNKTTGCCNTTHHLTLLQHTSPNIIIHQMPKNVAIASTIGFLEALGKN
jgi:hypothetical protein